MPELIIRAIIQEDNFMKLKMIGAALISAAVLTATSAAAFAGMLPGGGILVVPAPDTSSNPGAEPAPEEQPKPDTPNDVAPAPGTGADNPTTGAQGIAMVVGTAALAGAAVVVSRKKK